MVNFIRDIDDPYAFAQAHAINRSLIVLMVMILEVVAFLKVNENFGPAYLLLCWKWPRKYTVYRMNRAVQLIWLTFFCAIVAQLDLECLTDPHSFYMFCFV